MENVEGSHVPVQAGSAAAAVAGLKNPAPLVAVLAATRSTFTSLVRAQEFGFCDGIRSFAVTWVCCIHGLLFCAWAGLGKDLVWAWWPVAFLGSGDAGVDVFLVLSGFLIGGALQKEISRSGSISLGKFLVRRFFRIYPSLVPAVVLSALLEEGGACPFPKWYMYLMVWNNNLSAHSTECIGHTWSVALELQLYLATPLLFALAAGICWLVPGKRCTIPQCMLTFCAITWALCVALRARDVLDPSPEWKAATYYNTPYRVAPFMAGLAVGILIAERKLLGLAPEPGSRWASWAYLAVWLIFLSVFCANPVLFQRAARVPASVTDLSTFGKLHYAFRPPLLGVGVAVLIFLCAEGLAPTTSRFLGKPAWRVVAGLSYSIYLLQFWGMKFLFVESYLHAITKPLLGAPLWLQCLGVYSVVVLFILAAFPIAFLNYALVERPGIFAGRYCLGLFRGGSGKAKRVPGAGVPAQSAGEGPVVGRVASAAGTRPCVDLEACADGCSSSPDADSAGSSECASSSATSSASMPGSTKTLQ
mmetsp:Transcript_19063/g.47779  ORF Transcript_19063/g.47779 Transcript_19063/m.47779 type:complete len:532 (+) Transcript_19063:62-1657(+)